jgi:hypothetical protein
MVMSAPIMVIRRLKKVGNRTAFPHALRVHENPEAWAHAFAAALFESGDDDISAVPGSTVLRNTSR